MYMHLEITENNAISWAAYHASHSTDKCSVKGTLVTCLLPLFRDVAHSEAMIFHSMKVVRDAVNHINPGQVPVIAMDQPLYAIT